MAKQRKVSLAELQEAIKSEFTRIRYNAIFDFSKSGVTMEAMPTLLGALNDPEPGVVRYAAVSLGKLGEEARQYGTPQLSASEVIWELRKAASRFDEVTQFPQCYEDCLDAMVRIDPQSPYVMGLIHNHIGLANWYSVKASLSALKTIGSPEALDLLNRAVVFWMPELDKKQKRIVEEIAAGQR